LANEVGVLGTIHGRKTEGVSLAQSISEYDEIVFLFHPNTHPLRTGINPIQASTLLQKVVTRKHGKRFLEAVAIMEVWSEKTSARTV
jgi:hypothetical protein